MSATITTENLETVKGIYESFSEGDIEAVATTWAPDIEYVEPAGMVGGGVYRGPDEAMRLFAEMGEHFRDITVVPHTFVNGGDKVVVQATFSGIAIETGKNVEYKGAHVYEFDGEKISKATTYADTALINAALKA